MNRIKILPHFSSYVGLFVFGSSCARNHSAGALRILCKRFAERPPNKGGEEKIWTDKYVEARHQWLATASNPDLHGTVYRTQCFKDQIAENNWDLARLPVRPNGVPVSGV